MEPRDFAPGLYEGIPAAEYHADPWGPCLSASMAHLLVSRSPAHVYARHPRLGNIPAEDETEAMDGGSVLHSLLLGSGPEVVVVEAKDWRTNAAKDQRDDARAQGKIPVLQARYEELAVAAAEIEKNLVRCLGISLQDMAREVVALWEEEGVRCRARLDALDLAEGIIYDAKTVRDGAPAAFARTMIFNGLDIQHAAYRSAVAHLFPDLAGRVRLEFLRLELTPPYAVSRLGPGGSMRSHGESRWRRALAIWRRCVESGEWPGYGGELHEVQAPPWALEEEMEAMGKENPEADWLAGA